MEPADLPKSLQHGIRVLIDGATDSVDPENVLRALSRDCCEFKAMVAEVENVDRMGIDEEATEEAVATFGARRVVATAGSERSQLRIRGTRNCSSGEVIVSRASDEGLGYTSLTDRCARCAMGVCPCSYLWETEDFEHHDSCGALPRRHIYVHVRCSERNVSAFAPVCACSFAAVVAPSRFRCSSSPRRAPTGSYSATSARSVP
jgi:hypothetical protein